MFFGFFFWQSSDQNLLNLSPNCPHAVSVPVSFLEKKSSAARNERYYREALTFPNVFWISSIFPSRADKSWAALAKVSVRPRNAKQPLRLLWALSWHCDGSFDSGVKIQVSDRHLHHCLVLPLQKPDLQFFTSVYELFVFGQILRQWRLIAS